MRVFTYQIGDGDGKTLEASSHSVTLGAVDLEDAIRQAKAITKGRPRKPDENTVRLLEEIEGDSRVMWVHLVADVR